MNTYFFEGAFGKGHFEKVDQIRVSIVENLTIRTSYLYKAKGTTFSETLAINSEDSLFREVGLPQD